MLVNSREFVSGPRVLAMVGLVASSSYVCLQPYNNLPTRNSYFLTQWFHPEWSWSCEGIVKIQKHFFCQFSHVTDALFGCSALVWPSGNLPPTFPWVQMGFHFKRNEDSSFHFAKQARKFYSAKWARKSYLVKWGWKPLYGQFAISCLPAVIASDQPNHPDHHHQQAGGHNLWGTWNKS